MNTVYSFKSLLNRFFLLLSLTFYFVFFSGISVAQGSESDNITTLHELFQYIESHDEYRIFYQNDQVDVNQKVTIDLNQTDMSKLLTQALEGTGLSFKIVENHIVIMTKKEVAAPQDRAKVRGRITDDTGETLVGVSVVVKGTLIGTVTNFDGDYELEVPNLNDTLVFTYIGFEKITQAINGRTEINVIMKMGSFALEGVVAIGYGIKKQTDIIGSVSVVNSKEIASLPVSSVSEALQGKATGVNITQNTGAPGAGTAIRIRGTGTINDNSPLFIIDGVPTKDANSIPPSDIESISILKDAAASSIFGSRASNGVVLITTKKGKEGKMNITFDTYTGLQVVSNLTKMCDKDQYIEIYNEAATNDGRAGITVEMADTLPNTNWWDEIFRPAVITSTNLSVSGGSKNINYLVSGNYFHQDGIILNSSYDRYSFRTSVNSELSKKVNIGTNISLSSATTDKIGDSGDGYGGNGGSVVRYAFFRTPIYPVKDKHGDYIDYYPDYAQFFGDG
nr:SusC/RagA family TonB-linked outer membrane protein [Bacteroidota bacterium]